MALVFLATTLSPHGLDPNPRRYADPSQGETYRNSLAIAGRTGTLQNRFQDTPVENQFFGKTGTMTHVSALSGYLDLPDDSTLLVSILANQTGQSARITRQAIDDVVVAVHDWHSCSTTQP